MISQRHFFWRNYTIRATALSNPWKKKKLAKTDHHLERRTGGRKRSRTVIAGIMGRFILANRTFNCAYYCFHSNRLFIIPVCSIYFNWEEQIWLGERLHSVTHSLLRFSLRRVTGSLKPVPGETLGGKRGTPWMDPSQDTHIPSHTTVNLGIPVSLICLYSLDCVSKPEWLSTQTQRREANPQPWRYEPTVLPREQLVYLIP